MKHWTHKVVKQSRSGDGKWFSHRAATTGTLDFCLAYAECCAMEQKTGGHKITVQTRGRVLVKSFAGAAN